MSELEATNFPNEPTQNQTPPNQGMALDDARRVKTLSPGMLVFKRFIRNKLAVIGIIILLLMFIFSFLGPILSPYTQTQVFYKKGSISKDYAGAIYNTDLRYSVKEGETFGGAEQARFLLSLGKNEPQFASGGNNFAYIEEGEDFYRIVQLEKFAEAIMGRVNPLPGNTLPLGFAEAFKQALDADEMSFDFQGTTYILTQDRKATQISTQRSIAIGSYSIIDAYKEENNPEMNSYEFRLNSQLASINDEESFTANGKEYLMVESEGQVTILDDQGEP
ncbi:MAG: hypothetical protein WDA04_07320, partial [Anaerolineaceae bacterium]